MAVESGRIEDGLDRGEAFEFLVDGERIRAFPGESVAAALIARGRVALRRTARRGEVRGYYCGMGVCWECTMWLEGRGTVQACKLRALPGMTLRSLIGRSPAGGGS